MARKLEIWNTVRPSVSTPQPGLPELNTEMLTLLIDHGLCGDAFLIYQKHSGFSATTSSYLFSINEVQNNLKQHFHNQWLRNTYFIEELQEWGPKILQLKVTATLLKGLALLTELYPHIASRSIADMDLLVDSASLTPMISFLQTQGYVMLSHGHWKGDSFKYTMAKMKSGVQLIIELHLKLFYFEKTAVNWRYAPSQYPGFSTLEREDCLVHLSGHLGFQHTFIKLKWLLEIDRFICKYNLKIDWDRVFFISKSLGHIHSSQAVFFSAMKFFDSPVPVEFLNALEKEGINNRIWEGLLTEDFLWGPQRKRFRYFLVKHLLKDNLSKAIQYDALWLAHFFKRNLSVRFRKKIKKSMDRSASCHL